MRKTKQNTKNIEGAIIKGTQLTRWCRSKSHRQSTRNKYTFIEVTSVRFGLNTTILLQNNSRWEWMHLSRYTVRYFNVFHSIFISHVNLSFANILFFPLLFFHLNIWHFHNLIFCTKHTHHRCFHSDEWW